MSDLRPFFIPDMLQQTAQRYPSLPAIDFMGAETTYAQLWQDAQRIAAALQANGLRKGDRVGLMLPNCPAYLQFYFGTLLAGGAVVNINPLYAPQELKHILDDSEPQFVVTLDVKQLCDKLLPLLGTRRLIIARMAQALPMAKSLAYRALKRKDIAACPKEALHAEDLLKTAAQPQPVDIDLHRDLAVLQYTGGTTGVSKGAMLSHANLSANALQARHHFHPAREGEEKFLAVLPFFHAFALTTIVQLGVLIGATIIALPRFDLQQTLKTIHKKKPTMFPAVPTIYTAINHYPKLKHYDLRSINYCISGGAPLPLEVRDAFEKNTGCKLVEGYGLSEASPVVSCNPLDGKNKEGSIGVPLKDTVIEIVSLEDKTTVMPEGERGELCVRGPQVMMGYWKHPLETAETLRNGRLHTGDVALKDEEGYVYIVDRIKDMILCGGYNVYPHSIETAVYRHPAVEEVVCAGVPDSYRGETPKIWVKLKAGQGLSTDELKTFLKDYLSPIEMPKYIEFRDDPLPKTLIGKLSRKDLLAQESKKT
jgi:long-chain acyl-CoA synthetase